MSEVLVSDLDECPECDTRWAYVLGGERYSRIIGVYDIRLDRTIGWRCPGCGRQWGRDETVEDRACPLCGGGGLISDDDAGNACGERPCPCGGRER